MYSSKKVLAFLLPYEQFFFPASNYVNVFAGDAPRLLLSNIELIDGDQNLAKIFRSLLLSSGFGQERKT
jgi:hypothetical protein